jgi:hypothetical protein
MTVPLPRYVIAKRLASGRVAFYYNVPKMYRDLGCAVQNAPLGTDYVIACGEDGDSCRAAALNAAFDEWNALRQGLPAVGERAPVYGTTRAFRTQNGAIVSSIREGNFRSRVVGNAQAPRAPAREHTEYIHSE